MNCSNCWCIYEEDGLCCLDEIDIDSLGHCSECINVSIDDEILDILKKATRNRIMQSEEISEVQYPTIDDMIKNKKTAII